MIRDLEAAPVVRVLMRDGVRVNETIRPKADDCRVEEVATGGRMRYVSKRKPQHIVVKVK